MTVWTIAWWTETEKAQASESVREALQDWTEQWSGDAQLLRVEPAAWPDLDTGVGWQCVTGSGDGDGVWLTHPDVSAHALAMALCDEREGMSETHHRGAISIAVARKAARAFATSLCGHFDWTVTDDAPCALPLGLQRGGLCLSLRVGQAGLRLVLGAGVARVAARRVLGTPDVPLAALQDVVSRRSVTLSAALRPVRLEIGNLCSLAIGDVVALDHKLDEPVTVYAEDGSPVAEAHLSRIGVQKAIRLHRAAP